MHDIGGIQSIRMDVTTPDGDVVEGFPDDEINGQTSKDLNAYWFGSDELYSGIVGTYSVKLIVTNSSGISSFSQAFDLRVTIL